MTGEFIKVFVCQRKHKYAQILKYEKLVNVGWNEWQSNDWQF